MAECPWYVTAAAVRDYCRIAGWPDDEEAFARAEDALLALGASDAPRDTGTRTDSGAQIWRTGRVQVDEQRMRLELTVSTSRRPEGEKPQLIQVRGKPEGKAKRARQRERNYQRKTK